MADELTTKVYHGARDGLEPWLCQQRPTDSALTVADTAPLENEQAARGYLHTHVTTAETAVAVPFRRSAPAEGESASRRKLRDRLEKAEARVQGISAKALDGIKGAKSANVGCKACGSRVARKFLTSHSCPVCGKSLLPAGTQKRYEAAQKEVAELTESLRGIPGPGGGEVSVEWLVGWIAAEGGGKVEKPVEPSAPEEQPPAQPDQPSLF